MLDFDLPLHELNGAIRLRYSTRCVCDNKICLSRATVGWGSDFRGSGPVMKGNSYGP